MVNSIYQKPLILSLQYDFILLSKQLKKLQDLQFLSLIFIQYKIIFDYGLIVYTKHTLTSQTANLQKMHSQTPKNISKNSSYTSPIGLLKNYNTVNTSVNNYYEQQFYKIKSQRLQSEIQELKEQNVMLKAKLTDSSTANQMLKQKIFVLENGIQRAQRTYTQRTVPSFISDSGYPSANSSGRGSPDSKYFSGSVYNQKSQRQAYNSQLQRLLKQNRILKNQHEMEMSKLRDQIKKLNRKIVQLEQKANKKVNETQQIQQKVYRQKQQERLLKIQKANNDLRKDNEQFEKQRKKLQAKIRALQQNNQSLKIQNAQLNALNSARSRNETNVQEQMQRRQNEYIQKIRTLQNQNQQLLKRQKTLSPLIQASYSNKSNQSENNTINLSAQSSKYEKQIQLLKRKICLLQNSHQEKEEQIKNILIKLKPLIQKQKNNKNTKDQIVIDSKRASLSLLQVFLSKYKINSF